MSFLNFEVNFMIRPVGYAQNSPARPGEMNSQAGKSRLLLPSMGPIWWAVAVLEESGRWEVLWLPGKDDGPSWLPLCLSSYSLPHWQQQVWTSEITNQTILKPVNSFSSHVERSTCSYRHKALRDKSLASLPTKISYPSPICSICSS